MSNSLYHCTNSESLVKILKSQYFRPSFCLEESDYYGKSINLAFAVVCFADFLGSSDTVYKDLSGHMRQFHSDSYIKMKKNWALRNHLSPVFYYTSNSATSNCFKNIINQANENRDNAYLFNSSNVLCAYLKKYSGHYFDKQKNIFSSDEVIFYTEHEWRYVPLPMNGEVFFLPEEKFKNQQVRESMEDLLVTNELFLRFEWEDIDTIACPSSHQNEMYDAIKKNLCDDLSEIRGRLKVLDER